MIWWIAPSSITILPSYSGLRTSSHDVGGSFTKRALYAIGWPPQMNGAAQVTPSMRTRRRNASKESAAFGTRSRSSGETRPFSTRIAR
jgi:hypothetical protein